MKTWHIHITGRVQGVGFRPFIYHLVKKFGLLGSVCNTSDGVHIYVNEKEKPVDFIQEIKNYAPRLSVIENISISEESFTEFTEFKIIESNSTSSKSVLISPDFGLCDECKAELEDPNNRRYQYPFVTCTHCGPRYSIISNIPYDRENTTMDIYDMCPECLEEYNSIKDRRYYSQTNSCSKCGIQVFFDNKAMDTAEWLNRCLQSLKDGEILAMKGIGGYLLICDASNTSSIKELRNRKIRPQKPFAVLYPNEEKLFEDCKVSRYELKALKSYASPIVLLKHKSKTSIDVDNIAPGLSRIGVMLPYAPILELLVSQFDSPLVATSGNVSGSPIITDNLEAEVRLNNIADHILSNNRDINTPQDDSVLVFNEDQEIKIRRSRGYAPTFFNNTHFENGSIGMGALLKSSFAMTHADNIYVSQYLGKTTTLESQISYLNTLNSLSDTLDFNKVRVLVDKHPDYYSTLLGKELASKGNIEVFSVQHHKAHFAAVLAENSVSTKDKVLGVIWDGIGLGDDGNIWGGEFFEWKNGSMDRVHSLEYFPYVSGDRMALDPIWVASVWATDNSRLKVHIRQQPRLYWKNLSSLIEHNKLYSSSIGRLFDGVSGLLGLCTKTSFEGYSAMMLQEAAEKVESIFGWEPYEIKVNKNSLLIHPFLNQIVDDLNVGVSVEQIALRFHQTLVNYISFVAFQMETEKIAFSGGVFQNALLVKLIRQRLGERYKLLFHKQLPPNDENISFGQIAYYEMVVKNTNNKLEHDKLKI